tara:strand:- start:50 stop:289 length:240 start_codon:yes stop_codon:yes gene_type:complete
VINKILTFPIILIIKFYQFFISPFLGQNCRYIPSCSEYAIESLKIYGPLKGFYLAMKRIFKCHPWGGKGFDPVPNKIKK